MTPKEKALELCQRFGYLGIKWEQTEYTTLSLENAKQCALIAVDEIGTLKVESFDKLPNPHHYFSRNYWIEVKQEIEKL